MRVLLFQPDGKSAHIALMRRRTGRDRCDAVAPHTAALIATFRCHAPRALPRVRSGRCSVARRRSLRYARLERERITLASRRPGSSPPSVALRPRVAARSPMSDASWWATKRPACHPLVGESGTRWSDAK